MKKVFLTAVLMLVIIAVSVCSVGAYSLPKGTAVSFEEGASPESLVATEVFGFVGDVDLNGKLNVRDATHIQKAVAKLAEIDEAAKRLADADLSGDVNVKDATAVQKWLVGIEVEAPVYHTLYSTDDEAQIESVAGSWVGMVNIAKEINLSLKASGEYPGFDFECVQIAVCLDLNPDMTYSVYYDDASFDATLAQFRAEYARGMQTYFEMYIKENKLDTTVEDMLKTSGFDSIEKFAEQAVDESLVKSLIEFADSKGRFAVSTNAFYVSKTMDEQAELKHAAYYHWFDVDLVISGGDGILDPDMCPATFEKVM